MRWWTCSLTDSGETGKPPYTTPNFVWLRYVLGGLLFGIGMTFGSGCGNKTMVRIGGGNLKSVVVFLMMGVGAYAMIYTDFSYDAFLRWMQPLAINPCRPRHRQPEHRGPARRSSRARWGRLALGCQYRHCRFAAGVGAEIGCVALEV